MNEEDKLKDKRLFALGTFSRFFRNVQDRILKSIEDNSKFRLIYESPGKRWVMTIEETNIKKCPMCEQQMEEAAKNWYCPNCGNTPPFEEGEPCRNG